MAFNLEPHHDDRDDDASLPTEIMFDGSNYGLWMPPLKTFLNQRKLWGIITGELQKPAKTPDEPSEDYADRLQEWVNSNQAIISWLMNTSIPSISDLLHSFDTAKEAWDFLAELYAAPGDHNRQYHFLKKLKQFRQQPGQSILSFYSQMHYLWEQLAVFEPKWCCAEDAESFRKYRDDMKLVQFLIALQLEYEPVRADLLGRHPLPSFDEALSELVSGETRLGLLKLKSVASAPNSRPFQKLCAYCDRWGHSPYECQKLHATMHKPGTLILADLEDVIDHMSPDNVDLKGEVIAFCIKSADILKGVVSLILDKAVWNPTFCAMYASLCAYLSEKNLEFALEGPHGSERITFKRVLLDLCQQSFEGGDMLSEEIRQMTAPEQEMERRDKERLFKRLFLGNIRLFGELWKQRMLTDRIAHEIILKLLNHGPTSCPDETNVEAICLLFTTIGKQLDVNQKAKQHIDMYFSILKDMSTCPELRQAYGW